MSWRSRSYDELPALSIRGPYLRQSLRVVTIGWMFGVVWLAACTVSTHPFTFNRLVGFNYLAFGIWTAIPLVATLSQVVASILIERTGLRKYQFLHFCTVHRLMWIPIGLVPFFLPVPSVAASVLVLAFLGISWFCESLARPAWLTWMGDLVPRRIRGRYFARRGRRTQAILIVTVILLGLLMDYNWPLWQWAAGTVGASLSDSPPQRDHLLLYTISGVFIIGALFGARDILSFRKLRDILPPRRRPAPAPELQGSLPHVLGSLLIDPLRDRAFRRYVIYSALVLFSINMSSPFFWLYSMENLGFTNLATNLLFVAIGPLADMISSIVWGRVTDRWGRRPVLIIATVGTVLSLVPWFFTSRMSAHPQFLEDGLNAVASAVGSLFGQGQWRLVGPQTPLGAYMLAVMGCVIGGVSWSGVNLAQTNVTLGFSDSTGRTKYVAASSILISLGGAAGGLAGGAIAQGLRGIGTIGPWGWGNLHVCFALTLLVRLSSLLWLIGMPDPGAGTVRALLQQARINVWSAIQSRVLHPLRIFGWGSPGASRREVAARVRQLNRDDKAAAAGTGSQDKAPTAAGSAEKETEHGQRAEETKRD